MNVPGRKQGRRKIGTETFPPHLRFILSSHVIVYLRSPLSLSGDDNQETCQ